MSKVMWKPGTFLYPLPAVMISCGDMEKSNIITVAWTGILNTDPAMVYISVRPERYSYDIIKKINTINRWWIKENLMDQNAEILKNAMEGKWPTPPPSTPTSQSIKL